MRRSISSATAWLKFLRTGLDTSLGGIVGFILQIGQSGPKEQLVSHHGSGDGVIQAVEVIRTALACDILDALGLRSQALGPDIARLSSGETLAGRAFTAFALEVDEIPEIPYAGLLRALDAVGAGDVFVLATSRSEKSAMWGELLSTTCMVRGVHGVVTDGYARDTAQIATLGFPAFCRGAYPLDIHGRCEVTDVGLPVVIDGVVISPGDLVLGDADGVVVVPSEVAEEVTARAQAKAADENSFRAAVRGGMLPSEAYDRFKVL